MPYQRTINPKINVATLNSGSTRSTTTIPSPEVPEFVCESLYFAPPQWSSIDSYAYANSKWSAIGSRENGILVANTSWSNSGFQPTNILVTLSAASALPEEFPFSVDVTPREFTGQPMGTSFAVFNDASDTATLNISLSYSQPSRYIADLLIQTDIYVNGPEIICIDVEIQNEGD